MKNMKYDKDLYNFIKTNKKARERLYNNRTVAHIMRLKHPTLNNIELDSLEKYVKQILKLNRQWRKILAENEELRGLDYDEKKIAAQKYQIELGYEQGYYADVK